MTQTRLGNSAKSRVPFPQFSIRSLLGMIAVVSLSIVAFQFAWPRRTLQTSVLSATFDISLLKPHLDHIAEQSQSIRNVQCDPATNSIIIQAQARHMEAARKEIESIIADPTTFLASTSFGIAMQEARERDQ